MDFSTTTDPYGNQIVTVVLSSKELEELLDGKLVESRFTNPKIFVRLD